MDTATKKVAILVHDYFEQAEFTEPLKALKDAGVSVEVISASGEQTIHGLNHVDPADTFEADKLLEDVNPEEYDALILPGGAVNADNLRMVEKARSWVQHCVDSGKPLAAICHAPWVLVSSGVVEGRTLTSFFTIQDDLRNAGATWKDEELVTDGNILTSRNPDDLPAFCGAIVEAV